MTDMTTCANQIDCEIKTNKSLSGFLSSIIAKIKTANAQRQQRRIDRDAFRNLMSLDEAGLKDIGITRDDIIWASKLAMHESASKELEKIRASNIATARTQATRSPARRKL